MEPEYEDDFAEDYEDDDSGYDDSYDTENPFAAPKSVSGRGGSRRAGGAEDAAGRRTAGLGLLIQGWATVTIFLIILGMVGLGFLLGPSGTIGSSRGILALLGLGGLGILVASITILIGEGICLSIPPKSGAKGLITAAVCLLAAQVLLAVVQAFMSPDTGSAFPPVPMRRNLSGGLFALSILGALVGLGHLICFELFLNKASLYVRREDLAKQAMVILFGLPGCLILIIVLAFVAPLLGYYVAPILALLMLIPMLAAGIAIIVFAVMHVSLLFRVGSALRD